MADRILACLEQASLRVQGQVHGEAARVARFGGDEFIFLLPNTTLAGAEVIAERIVQEIRMIEIIEGRETIRFTISCGASALLPTDRATKTLLYRADIALLEAKRSGRDRAVISSKLSSSSLRTSPTTSDPLTV